MSRNENNSIEWRPRVPRYIKIIGIITFVIVMAYVLESQRRRNVSTIMAFYKKDVNGIVEKISEGSGGFYSIHTKDGQILSFCGAGSDFMNQVKNGDTIIKPPFADTLRVHNKDKNLKITFVKP